MRGRAAGKGGIFLRPREKRLIITFESTTDAMAMEARCRAMGKPGRLIPAPAELSTGCGMAWCAAPGDREAFAGWIGRERLRIGEIRELEL